MNEKFEEFQRLERDIGSLLSGLAGIFTSEEIDEVHEYVDHAEYGLAFETLCAIAKEKNRIIPKECHEIFRSLVRRMQIDEEWWDGLDP